MELKAWIDQLCPVPGSEAAAALLGEKKRTVDAWLRFETVPSFGAALNIVRKSGGVVDFNGIYKPAVQAYLDGRARFSVKERP